MADPHDYKIKYKSNLRGLDVLQAVFAFVMALGLREVFVGSYNFFTVIIFSEGGFFTDKKILFILMFLNILLLAMRFFWVPRSLRTLLYEASGIPATPPDLPALYNFEVSAHVFVILFHGMLFYLLGAEFQFIAFMATSSASLDPLIFSGYILMHVSLLIINVLWLGVLESRKNNLRRRTNFHLPALRTPGPALWFRNNLITSVLALGPFVMVTSCDWRSRSCTEAPLAGSVLAPLPVPSSPDVISRLYHLLEPVLEALTDLVGINDKGRFSIVFWVFGWFLLNSVWDLMKTGKYYLVLEDLDWEFSGEETAEDPGRRHGKTGGR